jgi:hypothetical protein
MPVAWPDIPTRNAGCEILRKEDAAAHDHGRTHRQTHRTPRSLTQSIEIMHRDSEDRFKQIANTFELALDSIKRLENIALAHWHRLDGIEGNGN